jgi:ribosome-binding protein aMBF1 (putative translation factor)
MPRPSRFSLTLIRIRRERFLSIAEIAQRAKVQSRTWKSWEQGKTLPKVELVREVEQRLGLERGSLMLLVEEQTKQRSYDNGRRRTLKGAAA